jgi:hypothetical protein
MAAPSKRNLNNNLRISGRTADNTKSENGIDSAAALCVEILAL